MLQKSENRLEELRGGITEAILSGLDAGKLEEDYEVELTYYQELTRVCKISPPAFPGVDEIVTIAFGR